MEAHTKNCNLLLSPQFISSANFKLAKLTTKQERTLLKIFFLRHFYEFLNQHFQHQLLCDPFNKESQPMERYVMDSRIIQYVISEIIQSDEYTLEGIANYTRVPLDVIIDAACGNIAYPSATVLMGIIGLYIQVKPDLFRELTKKLLATNDENGDLSLLALLNEK